MADNTPAVRSEQSLSIGHTPEQIQLITDTVAKGASPNELKLFLFTAQRTGLDPLTKQIHFVKRWDSKLKKEVGTIQTGIDGYRAIAERTGTLAGIDDAVFDDETKDHPNKATVTVKRLISGQIVTFTASARWNEYKQEYTKDGTKHLSPMWKKMPYLMLAKCAEALALRKAFPNDLSGLYTNEEMAQADVAETTVVHDAPAERVSYTVHRTNPVAEDEHGGSNVRSEQVQEEIDDARKQTIQEIMKHTLKKPVRKALVKELTGLEMIPENYEVIITKLREIAEKQDPLSEAINE